MASHMCGDLRGVGRARPEWAAGTRRARLETRQKGLETQDHADGSASPQGRDETGDTEDQGGWQPVLPSPPLAHGHGTGDPRCSLPARLHTASRDPLPIATPLQAKAGRPEEEMAVVRPAPAGS